MQIDLKIQKIDKKTTKIDVDIPQKDIDKIEKTIMAELSTESEIDGFKKGEAPEYVVRFSFKDEIATQRNTIVFDEISKKLLSDYEIDTAQMEFIPEYDKVEEGGDTFRVEFAVTKSIFPTIEMADYKQLLPRFVVPTISRMEIANELTRAIKSVIVAEPITEKRDELEKWDIAVLDIKTTIDEETTDSKNVMIEVGSGNSVPGFEDELIGIKVGYSKDINLTFPEDFDNVTLAGKDVKYKVFLNEIKMIKMPKSIDKAVLKKILPNDEKPTLDLLEQRISDNLFFRKLENAVLKEKINFMDILIEESKYDFNDEFLETEVESTFNTLSDEEKIKLEDDKKELDTYKENLKTNVISWYKYRLAMAQLFSLEDINIEDSELDTALEEYISKNSFENENKAREELLSDESFMASLRDNTMEEKLFYKLFNLTN